MFFQINGSPEERVIITVVSVFFLTGRISRSEKKNILKMKTAKSVRDIRNDCHI